MVEKRHYITALFLLILPVVVIYALANYGIEDPTLNTKTNKEISEKSAYTCQQKKVNEKEGRTHRLKGANTSHLN